MTKGQYGKGTNNVDTCIYRQRIKEACGHANSWTRGRVTCHVGTFGYVDMGTSKHCKKGNRDKWTRGHVDIVHWTRTASKSVRDLNLRRIFISGLNDN